MHCVVCLYVGVDSHGVVSDIFKAIGVVVCGCNRLVDGDRVSGDVRVVDPVDIGVRSIDEGLGGCV